MCKMLNLPPGDLLAWRDSTPNLQTGFAEKAFRVTISNGNVIHLVLAKRCVLVRGALYKRDTTDPTVVFAEQLRMKMPYLPRRGGLLQVMFPSIIHTD